MQTKCMKETLVLNLSYLLKLLKEYTSFQVCDDAALAYLQDRVSHLNELLTQRMERCKQWQVDMKRWYKQMGVTPSKELGKTFTTLDLDSEEVVWDKHFLDEFESAFDEVFLI